MIIVELAYLRGHDGKLIVKELALVGIGYADNSKSIQTYLLKAPCPLWTLSKAAQNTNQWITSNLHSLPWGVGQISYSELPNLVKESVQGHTRVVTKGSEKAMFLAEILGIPIIDLDNFECPKADNIFLEQTVVCGYGHVEGCALTKALKYAEWLLM
jgi:hypothetical protein